MQIGHLLANLSRNSKPPDVQDPIDDGIDNQNTVKLDDEQSQQTMTESYANVVQTNLSRNCIPPDVQDPNDDEIDNPKTVKPIILQDQDIFSSVKVTKPMWFTHVEIYKTIGAVVEPAAIKGIQRVRSMWRIYMDNEIDRLTLITSGVTMRGRHVGFHTHKIPEILQDKDQI